MFRPFIGRFTCVRLRGPHLTRSQSRLFTQRSPRRLLPAAACADLQPGPCRPTARDLLSSPTQLSFHTVKHILLDMGGGTFTFTYHADGMLTSKQTPSKPPTPTPPPNM